jgi:aerotaxis receptor
MAAANIKVHVTNIETAVPNDVFIYSRTDLKGHITEANDTFASISGYRVEEMLGKPHNLVRHPDMPREAFADMWRCLKAGRPWQGVVKNRRSDGGFYWVVANASPVREDGRIVGYQSIRFKPSREQINAANEAYRLVREEKNKFAIVDGRVVARRSVWMESLFGSSTLLRASMVFAIVSAVLGWFAVASGPSITILRTLTQAVFAISAIIGVAGLFYADRKLHRDLTAVDRYLDEILSTGNLKTRFSLKRHDRLGSIGNKITLLTSWV